MPRLRRTTRQSQLESDSDEEMDVDNDAEQVSKTQRQQNITRNGQRGRNKSKPVDSDSDEEEPQPSTSQASQKRKKKSAPNQRVPSQSLSQPSTSRATETFYGEEMSASQISPDTSLTEQETDHHVANLVKYILTAGQSNNPIEKTRISKDINYHNKKFKDIYSRAQDILKDVFGYELRELTEEDNNDGKAPGKQTKTSNIKLILVNTVPWEEEVKNLCDDGDEETAIHYALLFLTLAHIFMSGDKCSEDSLKSFLKKLEIVTDHHTRHDQFGDAMEIIKKVFTKEKYINFDNKENEFSWGTRATIELKPRDVMNFISEMYDGRDVASWSREYERLLAKEQNQRPNGQVVNGNH